jgi:hypothetical protein
MLPLAPAARSQAGMGVSEKDPFLVHHKTLLFGDTGDADSARLLLAPTTRAGAIGQAFLPPCRSGSVRDRLGACPCRAMAINNQVRLLQQIPAQTGRDTTGRHSMPYCYVSEEAA